MDLSFLHVNVAISVSLIACSICALIFVCIHSMNSFVSSMVVTAFKIFDRHFVFILIYFYLLHLPGRHFVHSLMAEGLSVIVILPGRQRFVWELILI